MNAIDPRQTALDLPLPLPPLPPAIVLVDPTTQSDASPLLPYASFHLGRRPRVWTVFIAFAVALIAGIVVGTFVPLAMVVAQNHGRPESGEALRDSLLSGIQHQPTVLLASGAATQVMLLITALSAAMLSPYPIIRRLRLNPSTLSPIGYGITSLGGLGISILFGSLVSMLKIHEMGSLKMLGDVIRHFTPAEVVFGILIVGIMPGFAEEFLFRGYIQTRLVQRLGRWLGIALTAVLFGVMHMDPMQGTFAMGFGFYIGYLAEKSGSTRPTMVCHAVNNSVQVMLGHFTHAEAGETPMAQAALVALISGAVVALCTIYIRWRVHPPASVQDDLSIPPSGVAFA